VTLLHDEIERLTARDGDKSLVPLAKEGVAVTLTSPDCVTEIDTSGESESDFALDSECIAVVENDAVLLDVKTENEGVLEDKGVREDVVEAEMDLVEEGEFITERVKIEKVGTAVSEEIPEEVNLLLNVARTDTVADALDVVHKVVFEVADSLTLPEGVGENVCIIDKVCVMDIIAVCELGPVLVDVVDLLITEVREDLVLIVAIFDTTEEEVIETLAVDDVDFLKETDSRGLFDTITDADDDIVDINDVNGDLETETVGE
jgi:hypothetical protein